jgi:uncharacterized membrane protein
VQRAPSAVTENIDKIIRMESDALQPRSHAEVAIEAIAGFIGTISFVVAQIAMFVGWVIVNAGMISQITPFDPFPYPLFSSATSLEAVLIAAFVLKKQNRMGVIADRRDHLDLQVNLLTERRATQIIQMLDRISQGLGVEQHDDAESRELTRHVAVEHLVKEVHSRVPDVPGDRRAPHAG